MTAALPSAGTAGTTGTGTRPAAHRVPRPAAAAWGRRGLLTTPGKLRALGAGLVLLALAWGGFGGWVATQHSSAADSLVCVHERFSLDARQLYQSIADADATITAAFLAGSQPPLRQLQRYQHDLATAHDDLSRLQAAHGSQAAGTALASLGSGLAAYNGYVGEAAAEYAMGYPMTGGSFLQVASEEAHLVLLPAASTVFTRENAALNAASRQATGLTTGAGLLGLAVVTGIALYLAQHWLARRTNRVFSLGLVLASLLLAGSVIWLAAAFGSARSDLDRGIGHGAAPAQDLALAGIDVQQIRGDAVLNVISRSGSTSFQEDFTRTSKKMDSYLGTAAAQETAGQGPALVAAARRDAEAWNTANTRVYKLGTQANYAEERNTVVGTTTSMAAGYTALERDITRAIAADQAVFTSAASSGASTLDPLTWVVAAASVLMAVGCGWAISRRLAEYR